MKKYQVSFAYKNLTIKKMVILQEYPKTTKVLVLEILGVLSYAIIGVTTFSRGVKETSATSLLAAAEPRIQEFVLISRDESCAECMAKKV